MKKLLIIDGYNVMFRAYYATAAMGNLMRNKDGFPTNMIYGFINIFTKVKSDNYTHIVVAFDAGGKTRRHKLYDDYKAGRAETPQELIDQIPYIFKYLDAMNVKYYMDPDYEADDIVASFSKKYGYFDEIDVLSNDNDLFQLISKNHFQIYTRQKETIKYSEKILEEEKGITPIQIPDYKGLIGDSSDNLKGVEGIGPVSASKLLKEYNSLEGIYESIDNIKGKTKEKLELGKSQAFFTKMMATLDPSYEIKSSEDDIMVVEPDYDMLSELFASLDFNSFLKKLPQRKIKAEFNYKTIKDPFELSDCIDNDGINHLYLENLGENYHTATPIGFGLTNSKGCFYIPYATAISSLDFLFFLSDQNVKKNVYDYKKMFVTLYKENTELCGVTFDILLASYLINPDLTKDDFKIITTHFGYSDIDFDETIYGKKGRESLPLDDIYEAHIAKKSFAMSLIYDSTKNEILENNQEELLTRIEIPLSKTLGKMETFGLRVDSDALDSYEAKLTSEMDEIEKEIYELSGHSFNILSPKQLGTVLFEELNLYTPQMKKTKTGYSTDQSVLESLQNTHPIINKILRYRMLSKLESTYVVGVRNALNEIGDGHIHTIYKQTLTDTGRLSSVEPNLQNLPARKQEASEFKKVFIPEDGCYLMSSDYSQIELRVLAHMSEDENLIKAFGEGSDIHEETAKAIYSKDVVTKEERRSAKAVNFGIVYGISSWGLANDIGVSPKEAQEFINKYHETFPRIEPFAKSLISDAENKGYVSTIFNRRRYIRDIHASNYNLREFSKRTAMNAPVQGTGADIIKLAMVELDKALEDNHLHAKLILTIHDEVVLNVPQNEIEKTIKLTEDVMTNVIKLKVPLVVSTSYGKNLYETK